jgi:hypothetical protein
MQGRCGVGSGKDYREQAPQTWRQQENRDGRSSCRHCEDYRPSTPSTSLSYWQKLIKPLLLRYRRDSFPMVGTLFPELEMKHPHGEVYTKAPSRPPRSRTASVATYKHTHFTPVYGHLVWLLSSEDGIAKQTCLSMARLVLGQSQAPVGKSKVPKLEGLGYTWLSLAVFTGYDPLDNPPRGVGSC